MIIIKQKRSMYALVKARAEKNPIVTKNGRIGKGITIEEYVRLFMSEGFTRQRAMRWANEWTQVGFILFERRAENNELVFLFTLLGDREAADLEKTINTAIHDGNDLWGRLEQPHKGDIRLYRGAEGDSLGGSFLVIV